jgi:2-oxoisovalerate dehydrogenase E1 component subunit alpha
MLYWGGDERGSDFSVCQEDFPVCVTVGGHAPHAAGVAMAFKLRNEQRAAVCVMGDGATSKGDVYEAMNLAGVWQLPVVFVISNNQWAISTRRDEQTGAATLAQKAIACGFEGEQVDGNDIVAVSHAIAEAVNKARAGGGPRLIECLTYRLADHTTSDDATRYRDDAETSRWWQQDPIARLRIYLTEHANWSKEDEIRLIKDCSEQVEAATETYLHTPPQEPASMFNYLFADLPLELQRQREDMLHAAQSGASDHD